MSPGLLKNILFYAIETAGDLCRCPKKHPKKQEISSDLLKTHLDFTPLKQLEMSVGLLKNTREDSWKCLQVSSQRP